MVPKSYPALTMLYLGIGLASGVVNGSWVTTLRSDCFRLYSERSGPSKFRATKEEQSEGQILREVREQALAMGKDKGMERNGYSLQHRTAQHSMSMFWDLGLRT